jgi:DNA (cytosine-5)-methyltransferase 1
MAGKRKGTDDERYLWGEMLRAIQEIKPKFVMAENVFGITNIDGGLVFEQVCLDLEVEGYEVQPFIIPAAAKNAPHRRDRCWFVAYSNSNGLNQRNGNDEVNTSQRGEYAQRDFEQIHNEQSIIKHTNLQRQKWRLYQKQSKTTIRQQFSKRNARSTESTNWENFPTQSPICGGDDGLPTQLDGITFSKWRAESIKGYGNAIVPQIAYEIFKQLWTTDTNTSN